MRAAVLALLLASCGPTATVITRFTDRPATADDLRDTWGEPCTVEQLSAGEERWTYCVELNDGHETWAVCRPDCEPAHRMRLVGGVIVADEPPSP